MSQAIHANRRWLLAAFLVVVPTAAFAQTPSGPSSTPPPAVSPYLNLFRPGTNPGVNYYGLVRPQMEFRSNIGTLRQEVKGLTATTLAESQALELPTTGHPVQFMNYGSYYGRPLSATKAPQPRSTAPPSRSSGRSSSAAPPVR